MEIKIPEYFKIREHIINNPDETILHVIAKTFDVSGNEVRRLLKQKSIKLRAVANNGILIEENLYVEDPNESIWEFGSRLIYIGSKKALYVKDK